MKWRPSSSPFCPLWLIALGLVVWFVSHSVLSFTSLIQAMFVRYRS
jgi:type IV secretory pathway TrbD component